MNLSVFTIVLFVWQEDTCLPGQDLNVTSANVAEQGMALQMDSMSSPITISSRVCPISGFRASSMHFLFFIVSFFSPSSLCLFLVATSTSHFFFCSSSSRFFFSSSSRFFFCSSSSFCFNSFSRLSLSRSTIACGLKPNGYAPHDEQTHLPHLQHRLPSSAPGLVLPSLHASWHTSEERSGRVLLEQWPCPIRWGEPPCRIHTSRLSVGSARSTSSTGQVFCSDVP